MFMFHTFRQDESTSNVMKKHISPILHFVKLASIILGFFISQSAFSQAFFLDPQSISSSSNIGFSWSFGFDNNNPDFSADISQSNMRGHLIWNRDTMMANFQMLSMNLVSVNNFDVGDLLFTPEEFSEDVFWITGTMTINATLEFLDEMTFALTDVGNDRFRISDSDFDRALGMADMTIISGTYALVANGPIDSQEIQGSFSINPSWNRRIETGSGGSITLDTSEHSQGFTLSEGSMEFFTGEMPLFEENNLLGFPFQVGLDVSILSPDPFRVVPEPSTYAFFAGIMLITFAAFRRAFFKIFTNKFSQTTII